jgi:hypothetical protein
MSSPPPQRLAEPKPNEGTEAIAAPSPVLQATRWLAGPTATKRKEVRAAPSPDVSANTEAGEANAEHSNRGLISALTCRTRRHTGWLSPRRAMEQRPEMRTHLTCPPPQWLVDPTPIELTDARAAPSQVDPTSTVACWAHADQEDKSQKSSLACRFRHHSGWMSPSPKSEQSSEKRPHLTCLPPEWLTDTRLKKGAEARTAPSPTVSATTVAA